MMSFHYFQQKKRVWRYQRGNQNAYIEEEQTTQWPKEKVQKDKQRSTKHTYKTKDRVTRTSIKTGDERRCCGRVSSSWSINLMNIYAIEVLLKDDRTTACFIHGHKHRNCDSAKNETYTWVIYDLLLPSCLLR
jgi:hypothetical protein